jgi:type IV pilus assembly protein PilM
MGFSMFSSNHTPIAIDFGSSSIKLLQITTGERPGIAALAEIPIPQSIQGDQEKLYAFVAEHLPKTLAKSKFRGKRCVISVPNAQTFTQHMQIPRAEGMKTSDLIKAQLQTQMGCHPDSVVVRSAEVGDVHRDGQARTETICFAIANDTVMRFVDILKKCKLSTVGVHTETLAMIRAFDHLNRRASDSEITTMYVDMGWGGIQVAIAHGKKLAFARHIQLGGRQFDQHIAQTLHCDMAAARAHRLALDGPKCEAKPEIPAPVEGAALLKAAAEASATDKPIAPIDDADQDPEANPERAAAATLVERRIGLAPAEYRHTLEPGVGATAAHEADLTELLDTVCDELSMCRRYHQGLFPSRSIDRAIFLGGEARQRWLCQYVVKALKVPSQLGDPLARMSRDNVGSAIGVSLDEPQPGWAVVCGLCTAPTDL